MACYTFILDYRGGTYISQIRASTPKLAILKGADLLDPNEVSGLGPHSKILLRAALNESGPVRLEGLENVWCSTASIRGNLALINLVKTATE